MGGSTWSRDILDSWQPTGGDHPTVGACCWDQFLLSKFPSPFIFSRILFSLSFPSSILTCFPLFLFPFYSPFLVLYLVIFSEWWVPELMDLRMFIYIHTLASQVQPTAALSYTSWFCSRGFPGWRGQTLAPHVMWYTFWIQKIRDLHFEHRTSPIPKYLISPLLGLIDRVSTLSHFFDLLSGVPGFSKISNPILLSSVPTTFMCFPIHI